MEARHREVIGRIDSLAAQHDKLMDRVNVLDARLDTVVKYVPEAVAARSQALGALEALIQRLRDTQALTARVYEHGQDWGRVVQEVRGMPDYELAYGPDPLVTVTIPTYNRADILCSRALTSLGRQTYPHWEAVVVGDGCTDDTGDRIADIGDPRIRWENLPFRGPYPDAESELLQVAGMLATNRALELANGRWIAPLDDDDEWDDDHLEVLIAEAFETRAEIVYGKWRIRDARNGRLFAEEFGDWPPRLARFAHQASIIHGEFRCFRHDMSSRFCGEPGDWTRARRLWDAGVRFAFVDRAVTTIWFAPRDAMGTEHLNWLLETSGYADGTAFAPTG